MIQGQGAARSTVLAVVDATRSGELAWAVACARARRTGGGLVGVRSAPEPVRRPSTATPVDVSVLQSVAHRLAARHHLEELAARDAPDLQVDLVVGLGAVTEQVVSAALTHRAAMVVVGDAGDRPSARLVVTVESVLQRARCPVLVARPSAPTAILMAATDLGDGASAIVTALGREVGVHVGATPLLVHVVKHAWRIGRARARLGRRLLGALALGGVEGEAIVVAGEPAPAILAAAEDADAEVIVLGAPRRGSNPSVHLGSVAEHVMRRAPCSVLVVPIPG